jgi:hypothetical protein
LRFIYLSGKLLFKDESLADRIYQQKAVHDLFVREGIPGEVWQADVAEAATTTDPDGLRLTLMAAVYSLQDLFSVPGARCHPLTGNLKSLFAVDLVHPFRLLFSADHDPLPLKEDGGLNLAEVTAVLIQGMRIITELEGANTNPKKKYITNLYHIWQRPQTDIVTNQTLLFHLEQRYRRQSMN